MDPGFQSLYHLDVPSTTYLTNVWLVMAKESLVPNCAYNRKDFLAPPRMLSYIYAHCCPDFHMWPQKTLHPAFSTPASRLRRYFDRVGEFS